MQDRHFSNAELIASVAGLLVGTALGAFWYFAPPGWRSLDHLATVMFGLWNEADRLGAHMSFSSHRPWMHFSVSAITRDVATAPNLIGTAILVTLLVVTRPISRFLGGQRGD